MPTSDWSDWLLNHIGSASPETVAIWYLGCNGVVLKGRGGTTVLVDPYTGLGDPPRTVRMIPIPFDPAAVTSVDAVLVTHEHADHLHGPTQGPILANTGARLYCPDDCYDLIRERNWTTEWNLDEAQLRTVSEGDRLTVGEFSVTVEPSHDPHSTHPVTYCIEHEMGTVFHGGDTLQGENLERIGTDYDIDIGILAFGTAGALLNRETGDTVRTQWYLDENGIVEAASNLQIDRLLPSHWDVWKGMTADPASLHHHARGFDYPRRVEVIETGDRIDL